MSNPSVLRALVTERLSTAAEDIILMFERTIAEYEKELFHYKRTNSEQKKLLALFQPRVQLHRAGVQTEQTVEHLKQDQLQDTLVKPEKLQDTILKQEQLPELPVTAVCVKTEHKEEEYSEHKEEEYSEHKEEEYSEHKEEEYSEHKEEEYSEHKEDEYAEQKEDESSEHNYRLSVENREETSGVRCGGSSGMLTQSQTMSPSLEFQSEVTQPSLGVGDAYRPFRCSECGATFQHQGELLCHMFVHSSNLHKVIDKAPRKQTRPQSDKPFGCSFCHKQFLHESHLVIHMRLHSRDRPYRCNICNKRFRTNLYLQNHVRIHTGEKPFSCPFCQRAFAQKSNLRSHLSVHTGERPYSCSICHKTFRKKWNLKKHFQTHDAGTITESQAVFLSCSSPGGLGASGPGTFSPSVASPDMDGVSFAGPGVDSGLLTP